MAASAGGGRGGAPQPYAGSYPESLVKDVIPFVEKRFRVLAAKDDRAIAGLSMGGGHTLAATNNNPGTFAYIGVFSSGPQTIDEAFQKQLEAVKGGGVKFYWLGAGTTDTARERTVNLSDAREEGRLQHDVPRDSRAALLVPVARLPGALRPDRVPAAGEIVRATRIVRSALRSRYCARTLRARLARASPQSVALRLFCMHNLTCRVIFSTASFGRDLLPISDYLLIN